MEDKEKIIETEYCINKQINSMEYIHTGYGDIELDIEMIDKIKDCMLSILEERSEELKRRNSMCIELKEMEIDGYRWIEITGRDKETCYYFYKSVYGIGKDGKIVDEEGYPLVDGYRETIAVLNTIQKPCSSIIDKKRPVDRAGIDYGNCYTFNK